METRTVETVGLDSGGIPLYNIRWAAIFAGLAVGLGVHLLLTLIGVAAGFAVYGTGARPDGGSLSVAAAVWNTISMVVAALVGGFVAARSSGLRRSADGMLHGVVSWGAAMLFYAIFTGSVTGGALTGMFGMMSPAVSARADSAAVGELLAGIERGDRGAAVNILRDRFGLDQEQAGRAADRALAMTGRPSTANPEASGELSDAAMTASAASTWLSVVILLSLLAGGGGGLLGARSARKRALPGLYRDQRVVRSHSHDIPVAG